MKPFLTRRNVGAVERRTRRLVFALLAGAIVRVTSTAFASDTPDIGALQDLFTSACSPVAHGWNRLVDADAVRYARWEGQSPDGRKHQADLPEGQLVHPFEDASDVRIFAADAIINGEVDYLTEGFWRGMTRVQGNPETEQSGRAAYARKLIEWIKATKLHPMLAREVTLFAQNGCTYGPSLLQVGWERTLGYRYHDLKLEELMAAAAQRAAANAEGGMQNAEVDPLTLFPQMVLDPTLDDDSVGILQVMHAQYVEQSMPEDLPWDIKPLSATRARRAIRELREHGVATLPLPYLCKNQPFVRARKLWEDIYVPESTGDVQEAPAVFLFDYYHEAELRALGKANDWNEDWVEAACKQKGTFSNWSNGGTDAEGRKIWSVGYSQIDRESLIEVITAQQKLIDEDGVLAVYETIYHGNIKTAHDKPGGYAKHGPMEYPIGLNYPVVEWRFEYATRALCATRGVCEVAGTEQRTIKVNEDMLTDRAAMETVPTRLVDKVKGMDMAYGPALDIGVGRNDMKPEYLTLGAGSNTAESQLERVKQRLEDYFGVPRPDAPPERSLIKRQRRMRSFLLSCSQALAFCFKLIADNLSPEEIEKITGLPGGQLGSIDDIAEDTLYLLTYDVQELSPDFVKQKNKALVEIATMDSSGTIDRAALTRRLLRSVDPEVEAEIAMTLQGAEAQTYSRVKGDFDDMLKGIPPQLTENDPTAQMQLNFAQQIMQASPVYQKALQNPEAPWFRGYLEAWMKSKQFSVEQTGVNKQSGKVGVDMNAVMEQQVAAGANTRG